jgi:glycosyltransferase 2 family protein
VMYACGLISACVYLTHLKEVRSLTASAHHLEEEINEGDLEETGE